MQRNSRYDHLDEFVVRHLLSIVGVRDHLMVRAVWRLVEVEMLFSISEQHSHFST